MRELVILLPRIAQACVRKLRNRIVGLLRATWQKMCPWDASDLPEYRALYAPPRRPPAGRRHRFGRRNAFEAEGSESASSPSIGTKPVLTLSVAELSISTERR